MSDQRLWEMRNGAEIADIVRQTLRDHQDIPQPDGLGRVHACTCGAWVPGRPWAHHLIDVMEQAGLDMGVKS